MVFKWLGPLVKQPSTAAPQNKNSSLSFVLAPLPPSGTPAQRHGPDFPIQYILQCKLNYSEAPPWSCAGLAAHVKQIRIPCGGREVLLASFPRAWCWPLAFDRAGEGGREMARSKLFLSFPFYLPDTPLWNWYQGKKPTPGLHLVLCMLSFPLLSRKYCVDNQKSTGRNSRLKHKASLWLGTYYLAYVTCVLQVNVWSYCSPLLSPCLRWVMMTQYEITDRHSRFIIMSSRC